MADIQLEHGHIRLANRLAEAILAAAFEGTQVRVLLALVRLTYGWKRKTVRVSLPQLADYAGVHYTGGFRRLFDLLIEHGVVLVVDRGYSRTPAAYAVQKDHEQWGIYSIAPRALAARWSVRPDACDDRMPAPTEAESMTLPPHDPAPTGAASVPPQGQTPCPHRGRQAVDNATSDNDFGDRKESERKERNTTPITEAEADLAVRLVSDADRTALTAIVQVAPSPGAWIAEVVAYLDGLRTPMLTAQQAGDALRDYVANGCLKREPSLMHFRSYLQRASKGERVYPPRRAARHEDRLARAAAGAFAGAIAAGLPDDDDERSN